MELIAFDVIVLLQFLDEVRVDIFGDGCVLEELTASEDVPGDDVALFRRLHFEDIEVPVVDVNIRRQYLLEDLCRRRRRSRRRLLRR